MVNLIDQYKNEYYNAKEAQRSYLKNLNWEQFTSSLYDFGKYEDYNTRRIVYNSHFHNNRWYNMVQVTNKGEKIQLRELLLSKIKADIVDLKQMKSFECLFQYFIQLNREFNAMGIKGMGQMTIYDLSWYLSTRTESDVKPSMLFIHRGVISGAKSFGLIKKSKDTILSMNDVLEKCPLLSNLEPEHLENLLCIYKTQLAAGMKL